MVRRVVVRHHRARLCVFYCLCLAFELMKCQDSFFLCVCVLFTDTQYIQHLSDNILYKFEKEKKKIQMTTIFYF